MKSLASSADKIESELWPPVRLSPLFLSLFHVSPKLSWRYYSFVVVRTLMKMDGWGVRRTGNNNLQDILYTTKSTCKGCLSAKAVSSCTELLVSGCTVNTSYRLVLASSLAAACSITHIGLPDKGPAGK